ncbi:MAG: cytochrome c [Gammaproteobacteria bacterium]|nr:cytochrome c [Gammaproteobacteria bacterium]
MKILNKKISITTSGVVAAAALSLSVSSVQASSLGEGLYMQHCAACHQPNGKGIPGFFPPLADNDRVNSDDPETIQKYLRRVIFGYHGGLIVNNQMYSGRMPPIGYVGRLNDSELLKLVNYQRSSWGSKARDITFDELTKARQAGSLK